MDGMEVRSTFSPEAWKGRGEASLGKKGCRKLGANKTKEKERHLSYL